MQLSASPLRILSNNSFLKLLLDTSLRRILIYDYALGSSPIGISRHFSFTVWICKNLREGGLIRQGCDEARCQKVNIVVADLARLPFKPNSFDTVCIHRIQKTEFPKLAVIVAGIDGLVAEKGLFYISFDFGVEQSDSHVKCWRQNREALKLCSVDNFRLQAKGFYYRNYKELYFIRFFWSHAARHILTSLIDRIKYEVTAPNRALIFSKSGREGHEYRNSTLITKIKSRLEELLEMKIEDPQLIRVGSGGGVVVDFIKAIVRMPMTEFGTKRCIRNFEAITALRSILLPVETPRPLTHGFVEGQEFYAESRLSGLSLDLRNISRDQLEAIQEDAFSMISDPDLVVTGSLTVCELIVMLEDQAEQLELFINRQSINKLNTVLEWARSRSDSTLIPLVIQHGDFKKSNFLISGKKEKKLTGLIDWDLSDLKGLPLLDVVTLCASSPELRNNGNYLPAVKEMITSGMVGKYLTPYCLKLGIDQRAAELLLGYGILKYVNSFPDEEKRDREWQSQKIDNGILSLFDSIMRDDAQLVS